MKKTLMACMVYSLVLAMLFAEQSAGVGNPAQSGNPTQSGNPAAAEHPAQAGVFLPLPLDIHYEHYDYHVMLFFEGHPEYEAVEAFIRETPDPEIRAIITRHDQRQTDYYNNENFIAQGNGVGIQRERLYAPMTYERGGTKKHPSVALSFRTKKGELVDFYLEATSAPIRKYGGLVDPGRHSPDTSLPVMYRDGSSLASAESFISFNDVRYDIPILVDAAPYFTGYKGYFSGNMRIAVIRAGSGSFAFTRVPESYLPGEKWIFTEDGVPQEWTITERHGSSLYVSGPDRVLRCIIDGDRVGLLSIACTNDDPGMTFIVDFTSPVRVSGGDGTKRTETEFSLSIAGEKEVVTGTVSVESDSVKTRITLAPRSPDWAVPRIVSTSSVRNGDVVTRETRILKGK